MNGKFVTDILLNSFLVGVIRQIACEFGGDLTVIFYYAYFVLWSIE